MGTLDAQLGFEALNKTNYRIVMVPKCESAEQVAAVEGSVWLPSLRLPAEC
ncbi:hypothetical protein CVCC1112_3487 [Paenarthrobacter nicotinovorans]|nr:hypothetical protein CVCC1112_3487 [Paenarthrobacter nicotinovorans]